MNLSNLAQAEPWMDHEERQTAATLAAAFEKNFADRQIPEGPFLTLRVENCLVHHALCRRLERALTPDPDADTPATITTAIAGHIGRARERLRKALKELEDTADKLAPTPEQRPNSAHRRIPTRESVPALPNFPATLSAVNADANPTPKDQPPSPSPIIPIPPTLPTTPTSPPAAPPKPAIPAAHPQAAPQPVIHVPRVVAFDRSPSHKG